MSWDAVPATEKVVFLKENNQTAEEEEGTEAKKGSSSYECGCDETSTDTYFTL